MVRRSSKPLSRGRKRTAAVFPPVIRLGLDWGRVRVGVAVSDEMGLLAHPLTSVKFASNADLVEKIRRLAEARKAVEIVVGLPRNMDGTEGESAAAARRLAQRLGDATGRPVVLWDERLTTWEAERILGGEVSRPRARQKKMRDQAAACLILQGYLDSQKNRSAP